LLRSGYAQISAANLALVLDQLRQRAQDLATAREAADAAQADAAQHKADESLRLNEVRQRQSEQQSLAAKTRAHLDAALAESSALANLDATLSSQIAAADAALRRRVASASGGSGGGGATVGENGTAVASGIRVAASIASAVNRLMAASARAGLSLDGGGWRNPSEQIALREAHCGSSHYAIYEAPSDSCHPPTAPPGSSMHERGLAIDFTCNGALIVSRSNPCYRWLARNAGRYGLQNLPSEPWHWSTNGD
jgi:LAS superfamily LD-carboxypeptidase LdcB